MLGWQLRAHFKTSFRHSSFLPHVDIKLIIICTTRIGLGMLNLCFVKRDKQNNAFQVRVPPI